VQCSKHFRWLLSDTLLIECARICYCQTIAHCTRHFFEVLRVCRWFLEANFNPAMGKLASHKNLKIASKKADTGVQTLYHHCPAQVTAFNPVLPHPEGSSPHAIVSDKMAKLRPNQARWGNLCIETPRKTKHSHSKIMANLEMDAYC
jgi:hypothetical protein